MKRPKRTTQRNDESLRNEQIRYHCEEIARQLSALKQLHPAGTEYYTKIGRAMKSVHTQHGGHPDA